MADNHNPTPQDLEALDALMRRALLLGEYHSFMDGVSLVYLHRVVQAARREAVAETAGEAVAYRVRMVSNDPPEWALMHPEKALDFLSRKGWENQPLYASPVPAQDNDKLRIACETARDALKCEGPEHELIYQRDRFALDRIATGPNLQRAIAAALKSTAAQEGGES